MRHPAARRAATRSADLYLNEIKETPMGVYTITPAHPKVPAATIVAPNKESIGNQAAALFARHKRLSRAAKFEAEVLDHVGEIRQQGIAPLRFRIEKKS